MGKTKLFLETMLAAALLCTTWAPLWPQAPTALSTAKQLPSQVGSQPTTPEWQTAAGGKMAFDTATVRENTTAPPGATNANFPLGPGDVYSRNRGLFRANGFSLAAYIEFAYKVTPNQEEFLLSQLPKWVTTERFDIEARAEGNPTKDQMRLMIQALLADRFRLAAHFENRQVPVFALILDRPGELGPQLQKHADESPCPTTSIVPSPAPTAQPQLLDARFPATCGGMLAMPPSAPGRLRGGARNVTMELIASSLKGGGSSVDRPVLDRTGLTGKFDFAIEFTPQYGAGLPAGSNFRPDPTGPTFEQALKEQLGLKLESQMGPMDFLVIDYIEKPSAN
jgi:uncharacterized protein (TIGR03435 family)